MSAAATPPPSYRSKTLTAWLAVLLGSLGLHRFYLHGLGDRWGWLFPLPTFLGLLGVQRMDRFGQDDGLAWLLIPWLGLTVSIAMLSAIVYALTPDEKWDAHFHGGQAVTETGWSPVLAAIVALLIGGAVLMGTLAFSIQKFFEWQLEQAGAGAARIAVATSVLPAATSPLQWAPAAPSQTVEAIRKTGRQNEDVEAVHEGAPAAHKG